MTFTEKIACTECQQLVTRKTGRRGSGGIREYFIEITIIIKGYYCGQYLKEKRQKWGREKKVPPIGCMK